MSILQNSSLKRSEFVEELYEAWKLDHSQAMLACDIDEFSRQCRELCQHLRLAWKARNDEFFKVDSGDLGPETARLDVATDKAAGVIRSLIAMATSAVGNGCALDVIDPLSKDLEALLHSQKHAPRFGGDDLRASIEESLADYARGDYRFLDEMIHER